MANEFYNSDTGVNWANVGNAALGAGISAATTGGIGLMASVGGSLLKGFSSSYFNKKSEKRAYQRMLQQMEAEYQYAQRYAENSPTWTVKGLRDAGINPILAFSGSAPSSPSVGSHSQNATSTDVGNDIRYDPFLFANLKSLSLDNELKSDNLKTAKAENEVRRLESEAKADLLRPVVGEPYGKDGKYVSIVHKSKSFKALQKAIADEYDLRSERYLRETAESVMKYGLDVLKLLPFARRQEIMKTIIHKSSKSSSGGDSFIRNSPKQEPVFQYD